MIDDDLVRESELRLEATKDADMSPVVADFYEERGQPTRAALWRTNCHRSLSDPAGEVAIMPPDLFASTKLSPHSKVDPRRDLMMWVMHNTVPIAHVARLFDLSRARTGQIIAKQWRQIANASARLALMKPTSAAIQRLVKAHALTPCKLEDFGDLPPDTWPVTRHREQDRGALRPNASISRARIDQPTLRRPAPPPPTLPESPMSARRKQIESTFLCKACKKRPSLRFYNVWGVQSDLCGECATP